MIKPVDEAMLLELYNANVVLQNLCERFRYLDRHDVADVVREAGSEVLRAIGRLTKRMAADRLEVH